MSKELIVHWSVLFLTLIGFLYFLMSSSTQRYCLEALETRLSLPSAKTGDQARLLEDVLSIARHKCRMKLVDG